ncbi:hypothetical protein [Spirosoma linguale]|uniref:hypothetical protein n=1 Tax=Spirosoma linguale TaxID=108 RepID=UPI003CC7C9A0
MIPEIPERTSYLSSSLFLIFGLFFSIYPISGILKNDLVVVPRASGIGRHLHGVDATVIGIGVILLGISCVLSAIRNILDERQRDQYLYKKVKYPSLYRFISTLRNSGMFVIIAWSLVSCSKSLIDLFHD